jgi:SAM-dependent methyltransferase
MPHHLSAHGTLLHVGCGSETIANTPFAPLEWQEIRLDINPAVHPDRIGTITSMEAVESGSVDAIFSSHNIEHLEAHEVPLALAEFRRVLRPGGLVLITCPDLNAIAERILTHGLTTQAYLSPAGPISPLDMLYGLRSSLAAGNRFMAHRCGFNEASLDATLRQAGFAQVVTMGRPPAFDLWALATVEEWPEESLGEAALTLLPVLPGASLQPRTPS